MRYVISYSITCHTGKIRSINQDNFWHSGFYLDAENNGLKDMLSGTVSSDDMPMFAVFDGMGGEQKGEYASFIAAHSLNSCYKNKSGLAESDFLIGACKKINTEICNFQSQNGIAVMGTTGAIVLFGKKSVNICNIGDSRIYRFSKKKLSQISMDHSAEQTGVTKPRLTQYLGIREDEFIIQPYLAQGNYKSGDRFLICSDGLTDMVSHDEIEAIISKTKTVAECNDLLLQTSLQHGGRDNITIIVCEVKKRRLIF